MQYSATCNAMWWIAWFLWSCVTIQYSATCNTMWCITSFYGSEQQFMTVQHAKQCDVSHHFMVVCVCDSASLDLCISCVSNFAPELCPPSSQTSESHTFGWLLFQTFCHHHPKQVSLIHLSDFSFKLSVTIIQNKWVSCETLSPSSETSQSHTFVWLLSQTFCHHRPKQVSFMCLLTSLWNCHHHPKQVSLIHLADFSFKLSLSSTYLSVLPWWLRIQTCLLITPKNKKNCTCEHGPSGICRVSCCSIFHLTTQGVTQYMQFYMDEYIPHGDRTACRTAF